MVGEVGVRDGGTYPCVACCTLQLFDHRPIIFGGGGGWRDLFFIVSFFFPLPHTSCGDQTNLLLFRAQAAPVMGMHACEEQSAKKQKGGL